MGTDYTLEAGTIILQSSINDFIAHIKDRQMEIEVQEVRPGVVEIDRECGRWPDYEEDLESLAPFIKRGEIGIKEEDFNTHTNFKYVDGKLHRAELFEFHIDLHDPIELKRVMELMIDQGVKLDDIRQKIDSIMKELEAKEVTNS